MPGRSRAPLRSIVVAGDGPVGLAAAIALRRALPRSEITLVAAPAHPAAFADNAVTSLPQSGAFHRRHGIDEDGLMVRAGASHRLAVEMIGWAGSGSAALHAYGAAPPDGVDAASALPISATLAAAGRFALPSDDPRSPLADIDYALRFNPAAYRRHLAALAGRIGVHFLRSRIEAAIADGAGRIGCLALADGESIAADLFVDCTGPRALLASALPRQDRESWSTVLPCDLLLLPAQPGPPSITPLDQIETTPLGWQATVHGRDGTHICLATSTQAGSPDAIARAAGFESATAVRFEPGRLIEAWKANVVCFGDAAAQFEPLHWLNLALAQAQIALFMELLPGRDADVLEQSEFNRRSAAMADRVRDFIALHYCATRRLEGPFWAGVAGLSRPESLQRTLSEFARRGRLPFFEEELLPRDAWLSAMATIGLPPGPAARLLAQPPDTRIAMTQAYYDRGATALAQAVPYPQWLSRQLGALQ